MKKGFTLIELIFAIVIIGVLSAVAVPKFTSLKSNAEVSNVIKVAEDAYSSIPSAYVSRVDLNDENTTELNDLVNISGKGWDTTTTTDEITYSQDGGTTDIITLTLDEAGRTVSLSYNCAGFTDDTSDEKCQSSLGIGAATTLDKNVSF
jgi:general secretion pathway protein G